MSAMTDPGPFGSALPRGGLGARALAAGLLLALVALIWLGLVAPALDFYAERQVMLEDRRALAARMEQTARALPALRARAASAPAAAAPAPGSDALSFANLATALEQLAAAARVTISSTEAVPDPGSPGRRAARASLRLSGPYAGLVQMLKRLALATPEIIVERLDLSAGADAHGVLDMHLVVHAAAEVPAG